MPASQVEVRRPYTDAEAAALLDAVHASLVAAFRIPEDDRTVRLVEHDPARFAVSPSLDTPERYTIVTIDCFSGRTLDAKRALYAEIVTRFEPLGIPRDHVKIIVHDVPRENWGLRGGQAGSDIQLDFTVEV